MTERPAPPPSRLIGPEGRAAEFGHLVNESMLGVKRAWLSRHHRGPTAPADDEKRRLELAAAIFAAIASVSAPIPGPWNEASSRVPALLRVELGKQQPEFIRALAAVGERLAQPGGDVAEADFKVLDDFASLVARAAMTVSPLSSP
jgi:hypothetical protein